MPRTVVPVPSGGLDLTSPAGSGRRDTASKLLNLLPGMPGKLALRGPFAKSLPATAGSILRIIPNATVGSIAAFRNDAQIQIMSVFDNLMGQVGVTAAPAGITGLGTSSAERGDKTYATTAGGRGLLGWAGSSGAAAFVEILNGPKGATSVTAHLQRLFVLGGSVPGTAVPAVPQNLYWTDPGWDGFTTDTIAAWQDDVSGLTNKIDLGHPGDTPLALAVWQERLYIFRNSTIQALIGSSPASWQVKTVANYGLAGDDDSVAVTDEGIYFQNRAGLMFFDGLSVRPVSGQIAPIEGDTGGSVVELPGGYLGMLANAWSVAGGAVAHNYVIHRATNSWGEVDGPFKAFCRCGARVVAYTGTTVVLYHQITQPGYAKAANSTPGLDYGTTPIVGVARSRPIMLNAPFGVAVVRRLLGRGRVSAATGSPKWSLTLLDEAGSSIGPVLTAVGNGTDATSTLRTELHREADAVIVQWTLDPAGAMPEQAEVHDAYLEWDPAQSRTV